MASEVKVSVIKGCIDLSYYGFVGEINVLNSIVWSNYGFTSEVKVSDIRHSSVWSHGFAGDVTVSDNLDSNV